MVIDDYIVAAIQDLSFWSEMAYRDKKKTKRRRKRVRIDNSIGLL